MIKKGFQIDLETRKGKSTRFCKRHLNSATLT